ncbi:MAG: flagellar hook-length control protein FliK [Lachnospiraceae bacterium]|nr:flagellar hook-length control protein FliK [Lachnospiraceae bacterium]
MWIKDLLQSGKQTGNAQNTQNAQNAQNAQTSWREPSPSILQKEIRALAPGQVLSGQILEKTGEDLRLLVNFQGSELEIQARLEQSIALSMGRNILFQVKNNGSSLSLSPLFENMGMEANAQKAVEMASLPVNDTTMQLVGQLMKEGMPIDKEALQTFYHEVTAFADAEVMDIIDLHKLGLPVNEENLEQLHSYKNMTHQIMGGVHDIGAQLPGLLQEMAGQGLEREIGRLLAALLLGEDGKPAAGIGEAVSSQPEAGILPEAQETAETLAEVLSGNRDNAQGQTKIVIAEEALQPEGKGVEAERLPQDILKEAEAGEGQPAREIPVKGQALQRGQAASDLLRQVARALAEGKPLPLKELAKSPQFQKQLQEYVRQELSLRPQDASKEKLGEMYSRLGRQLGALSEALGSAGQEGSALGRTVQNLSQNLNFLNQLNDMYSYVQLPLKMMDQDAHGELYVYTNRHKKAVREGEVSALLHLDMANLGPMDVYVQLKENHVGTRFYLPDEEMLDFIAEHIDLLNSRLEQRGYHMNCAFQTREPGTGNTVMQELIEARSNRPMGADYSFDAFA